MRSINLNFVTIRLIIMKVIINGKGQCLVNNVLLCLLTLQAKNFGDTLLSELIFLRNYEMKIRFHDQQAFPNTTAKPCAASRFFYRICDEMWFVSRTIYRKSPVHSSFAVEIEHNDDTTVIRKTTVMRGDTRGLTRQNIQATAANNLKDSASYVGILPSDSKEQAVSKARARIKGEVQMYEFV